MIDIDFKKALELSFYRRHPELVAKELLGKLIVKKNQNKILAARIVETEAYLSEADLSCHAARGKTSRNAPMFEDGGVLYVYKIYGVHHCINFVTEIAGKGSAVLIRAAEPIAGVEEMMTNRGFKYEEKREGKKEKGERKKEKGYHSQIFELCKGPGNLAKAFGFTKNDNFKSLKSPDLFVQNTEHSEKINITVSKRIGITKSSDLMLRYFIQDSPYVSVKKS